MMPTKKKTGIVEATLEGSTYYIDTGVPYLDSSSSETTYPVALQFTNRSGWDGYFRIKNSNWAWVFYDGGASSTYAYNFYYLSNK